MKSIISSLCFLLIAGVLFAQGNEVQEQKENLFIEVNSKNEQVLKTADELSERLKEWNYWHLVSAPEQSDLQMRVHIEASKGITATSWGGTSYALSAKIIDQKGEVLWESTTYKASPNGTNGFNAGKAVLKKLMRDLKKKYLQK